MSIGLKILLSACIEVFIMTIQEIRALTNLSQPQFCEKYHIPLPTLRKWEQGKREPPDYLVELLEFKVREDLKNDNGRDRG